MNSIYHTFSELQLIQLLAKDDQLAFDELYERYFTRLFNYAYKKVDDHFLAQEVVQELFINLWQQRKQLVIKGVVSAYIFTSVKNLIIDQYRRETLRFRHADAFSSRQTGTTNQTEEQIWANDLEQTYEKFLIQLPDKCRQVFKMSRQGFANREIAQELDIAEKTVEQHITKALRLLRPNLPHYLFVALIFS